MIISVLCLFLSRETKARDITFCGEVIPVENAFVANKLMTTIRRQIPVASLQTLRVLAKMYLNTISAWLKYYKLPDDLKYIPIVECGFRNAVSRAGARGFWQIMPDVAIKKGMVITATYDERDNPTRSTEIACQLLQEQYKTLQGLVGVKSWVLTAAAYNFGPGNIHKAVRKQGKSDYFQLQLNDETAAYVYKLIAIKELFERPELYMNGFDGNIFASTAQTTDADVNNLPQGEKTEPDAELSKMEVVEKKVPTRIVYVVAQIVAKKGKNFRDGGTVSIILKTDLRLPNFFSAKGNTMMGRGWLIDNRVLINLGREEIEVVDKFRNKGISVEEASQNGQYVYLKTEVPV